MAVADARIDLVNNGLVAEGVTPSGIQVVKSYTTDRRNYILGQLATVAATFAVDGPANLSTANSAHTLSGTAPVNTATIEVNGLVISPVWSSVTGWSASYLLAPGTNILVIRALDGMGNVLGTTTITVTYTGTASWPALRINEWMAANNSYLDPVDEDADDWLEIYNPTGAPVNLANWRLSDNPALPAKFLIPAGYSIPAGGRLLVWADNEVVQNNVANSQLHAGFKLGANSGAIVLSAPDGTLIDSVSFGAQTTDRTGGRYPDGAAEIHALTLPTPLAANAFTRFTELTRAASSVTLTFTTTPGLRYQIEYSDELAEWLPLGIEQVATGETLTLTDPAAGGERRFYRAVVSE
jgi:hypothetical protein